MFGRCDPVWLSMSEGFSMTSQNVWRKSAAVTSSTIRASHDVVTVMRCCGVHVSALRTLRVPPTARMHACGGLMTAIKDEIPNIPRFEILRIVRQINALNHCIYIHYMSHDYKTWKLYA